MAKTHKTRPVWVRMMDSRDPKVGVEEIHKHVKGFCDLPERNAKALSAHYENMQNHDAAEYRESCSYRFSYQGVNVCGCASCTGHFGRRAENRRKRHETKLVLKGASKSTRAILDVTDEIEEDSLSDFDDVGTNVIVRAAY